MIYGPLNPHRHIDSENLGSTAQNMRPVALSLTGLCLVVWSLVAIALAIGLWVMLPALWSSWTFPLSAGVLLFYSTVQLLTGKIWARRWVLASVPLLVAGQALLQYQIYLHHNAFALAMIRQGLTHVKTDTTFSLLPYFICGILLSLLVWYGLSRPDVMQALSTAEQAQTIAQDSPEANEPHP